MTCDFEDNSPTVIYTLHYKQWGNMSSTRFTGISEAFAFSDMFKYSITPFCGVGIILHHYEKHFSKCWSFRFRISRKSWRDISSSLLIVVCGSSNKCMNISSAISKWLICRNLWKDKAWFWLAHLFLHAHYFS